MMMMWIRKTWMNLMHRHWTIQGGHLMLLFPLHPSILEPDLNLSLRHQQGMSNFYPPPACQVAIKMKFFFQFESLVSGVGRPDSFLHTILINIWVCKAKLIQLAKFNSNHLHVYLQAVFRQGRFGSGLLSGWPSKKHEDGCLKILLLELIWF